MNIHPDNPFPDPFPDSETPPASEDLLLLLRLLVGGTMEGLDAIMQRLRERQHTLDHTMSTEINLFPNDETNLDQTRYALIGLTLEMLAGLTRRASSARRTTGRIAGVISGLASPITHSWLMQPVRRRYAEFAARREAAIERWIETGRIEEGIGRLLARDVTEETLDELLDYLARKPEVRELVQQQGQSLAGELVSLFRRRSAAADDLIDRFAGPLRRQSAAKSLPAPRRLPPYVNGNDQTG